MMRPAGTRGFTLLEISVVLVIIGLLVGGVVVGSDMIHSSQLNATLRQYREFQVATQTFANKYGGLPADLAQQKLKDFGFYDRTAVSASGNGDEDGYLYGCAADTQSRFGCEIGLYWRDLNTANLITGDFQYATATIANNAAAISVLDLRKFLPESKLEGNFWTVFGRASTAAGTQWASAANYFVLTGIASIAANGQYSLQQMITPRDAAELDRKIDDGRGLTGIVKGMLQPVDIYYLLTPTVNSCVMDVAPNDLYNNTANWVDTPRCQLRFDF